jgi:hypothetical protein
VTNMTEPSRPPLLIVADSPEALTDLVRHLVAGTNASRRTAARFSRGDDFVQLREAMASISLTSRGIVQICRSRFGSAPVRRSRLAIFWIASLH